MLTNAAVALLEGSSLRRLAAGLDLSTAELIARAERIESGKRR